MNGLNCVGSIPGRLLPILALRAITRIILFDNMILRKAQRLCYMLSNCSFSEYLNLHFVDKIPNSLIDLSGG